MAFLAPVLLVGLSALTIPVLIHLVQRERRQVIPFPSLMFIRRIPYQSVRRRRIRDWLLLAVRTAALLLIVLAFARPFFARGALASAAAAGGGREVVILLDRSASMAYGDHWARARAAARHAVDGLGAVDRATLVLFAATAEESVRATANRGQLDAAIDAVRPGSGATRYGPALKLAMSVLAKSSLPHRAAVLISDFQKSGWRGGEDVRFPEATVLTPVSVASADARNVSVTSVSLARAPFSGKERVTVTAAIRNAGAEPVRDLPVSLQIGNAIIETVQATIGPNASAPVAFAPFTLATAGLTATIRAGTDLLPDDNVFRLVLAPSSTVDVLLVEPEGTAASGLYLRNALSIGTAPAFKIDSMTPAAVTPPALDHHAVVILDGVSPARIGGDLLRRFVERGGGVLTLLGGDASRGDSTPAAIGDLLPRPAPDDRASVRETTIGYVDYSHPVFEIFQGPHGGDFSGARVYRYRAMTPAHEDRVLARFSDGGIALLERRIGSGRAIAWTSTLDDTWNDLALKPVFLPFVQQLARYLARYQDQPSWYTVGQAFDLEAPGATTARGASPSRLVLTPSGRRLEGTPDGRPLRFVELDEQGFYEVRTPGAEPVRLAANLDPAESDLTTVDPQELVAAVTGHAQPTAVAGASPLTAEELERRQSIWRYLLFAGLLVLVAETLLSNRLSAVRTAPGASLRQRPKSGSPATIVEGRVDVAR